MTKTDLGERTRMPYYDFACPEGHSVWDVNLPLDRRDSGGLCVDCGAHGTRLLSKPTMGSVGGTGNKRPAQ